MADEILPVGGVDEATLADASLLSSLADETPEGRSVIDFVWTRYGVTSDRTTSGGKLRETRDEYFERETSRMIMRQSLEIIEAIEQFDVTATVKGGGHSAQAEAMRQAAAVRSLHLGITLISRGRYDQAARALEVLLIATSTTSL